MKNKLTGNLIYGQSGGPTSVINASAAGLFLESFKHLEIKEIYAMHYGILGILNDDIINIKNDYTIDELKKLIYIPGANFGSNRYKLSNDLNHEDYKKILEIFKKYNIRYFFYNGGNDSMDTLNNISKYLKLNNYECNCIGIPKTIDNDLMYFDHSPGFPSSAKFIINSVKNIYFDDMSYFEGRVNIVEVMGRNAGWLTASVKYLKTLNIDIDMILVPEIAFNIDSFLNKVNEIYSKKKHCLIVVSEGIKDEKGSNIFENSAKLDSFGHNQLGGVALKLTEIIKNKFNFKTRAIELSLLQRASSPLYNFIDIKEAMNVGKYALRYALKGENAKVVGIIRVSSSPYKVQYKLINIEDIANKEKFLDAKYITNNEINDAFLEYIVPLID